LARLLPCQKRWVSCGKIKKQNDQGCVLGPDLGVLTLNSLKTPDRGPIESAGEVYPHGISRYRESLAERWSRLR
jgi:hypothetical protein